MAETPLTSHPEHASVMRAIDQDQDKARVLAMIRARRARGTTIPFKANITTSESELTLDADGVWRLCLTKVIQIKYVDEP